MADVPQCRDMVAKALKQRGEQIVSDGKRLTLSETVLANIAIQAMEKWMLDREETEEKE